VSDRLTEEPQQLEATAATVEALARALELHDYRRGRFGETSAHTARVTQLALQLAEVVAPELALEPQLAYGFRLHERDAAQAGRPLAGRGRRDP
jgi:response regulator RpfG family c-di-GMP phosphodiesterase